MALHEIEALTVAFLSEGGSLGEDAISVVGTGGGYGNGYGSGNGYGYGYGSGYGYGYGYGNSFENGLEVIP